MLLLNGDCLELMKTLPDKSVDLFICDLPYGCLTGGGGKEKAKRKEAGSTDSIAGCSWDIKIDLDAFWIQVERLMKNDHTPIIQFCNTRFGNELINSKPKWFRYDLVWSKSNGVGFLSANKQPLRSHENIYVFSKKGANYNRIDILGDFKGTSQGHGRAGGDVYAIKNYKGCYGEKAVTHHTREGIRCVKSVIELSNKKARGQHPTAKPVDLYKFLIERYSNEGDTVLDPTFGSGNSGVASVELGREYIGIEMNEVFFNKFFSVQNINATPQDSACREGERPEVRTPSPTQCRDGSDFKDEEAGGCGRD
jgi:site-specific DNA-methyltransferase (adenine-specific)